MNNEEIYLLTKDQLTAIIHMDCEKRTKGERYEKNWYRDMALSVLKLNDECLEQIKKTLSLVKTSREAQ